MTSETITIGEAKLTLDSDVATGFLQLEGNWNVLGEDRLMFTPNKATRQRHPGLNERGRRAGFGMGSLVHYFIHGHLPTDGLLYRPINGVSGDYRRENLERISRSDLAREKLGVPVNPDSGITPTPNGRYRARAYVNGRLHAVGTYDTLEQARAARDEAIAHPERYPSKKKTTKVAASKANPEVPVTTSDSLAASLDEAIAGVEALLATLRQKRAAL